MKWILVMFIYSCYNPDELEIIYEGTNDYIVYSYDNHECGVDNYSEDNSEYTDSDYTEPTEEVVMPVEWAPPALRYW